MKPMLLSTSGYWNYRTGEYDHLTHAPLDWSDYIPQDVASQGLYERMVQMGVSAIDAASDVLKRSVGE